MAPSDKQNDRRERRVLAETIRYVESSRGTLEGSELVEQSQAAASGDMESRILDRAAHLGAELGLQGSIGRARGAWRAAILVLLAIAFLAGVAAAGQAVSTSTGIINFYWLLLVLLGFHAIALLAWLLMLLVPVRGASGLIGRLAIPLVRAWTRAFGSDRELDGFAVTALTNFGLRGRAGQWRLGAISHAAWASYLAGGLLLILVRFSAQQYDFVWETTLLPDDVFINLTAAISALPQSLGFATPAPDQVLASRPGAEASVLAAARGAWAGLLLASMLLYGFLPRLLLSLFCYLRGNTLFADQRLDLTTPYYARLSQCLSPPSVNLGVVDPDEEAGSVQASPDIPERSASLPPDLRWIALETDPSDAWPPPGIPANRDLGRIGDAVSQATILAGINPGETIAIGVPLARSADRGLARLVGEIIDQSGSPAWLVLLDDTQSQALEPHQRYARTVDWYRVAGERGIPADQVILAKGINTETDTNND